MPFDDIMDSNTPELNIHTISAISTLHSSLDLTEESVSTEMIQTVISSIASQSITPDEQALGKFTCRKLNTCTDIWDQWKAGERKQLNQFHDLEMFGVPVLRPNGKNLVNLCSHW